MSYLGLAVCESELKGNNQNPAKGKSIVRFDTRDQAHQERLIAERL